VIDNDALGAPELETTFFATQDCKSVQISRLAGQRFVPHDPRSLVVRPLPLSHSAECEPNEREPPQAAAKVLRRASTDGRHLPRRQRAGATATAATHAEDGVVASQGGMSSTFARGRADERDAQR
jgi:hypothetical protein